MTALSDTVLIAEDSEDDVFFLKRALKQWVELASPNSLIRMPTDVAT